MRKILVLVLIVTVVLYLALLSPVFKIKTGKIEGTDCVNQNFPHEINVEGKNIFLISTQKIKNDLKNKYSCLGDLEVKKDYPSTISVKADTLKSVLKIDGSDFTLTADGLVIKYKGSQTTPVFFAPQGIQFIENQKITDKTILFVITLADDIQKSDFVISNIRIVEQGSIAVYSRQESVAIFSQSRDIALQIDSLQAILAKAKIDSSKIEKIDLRFDKPILVLKKQS